MQVAFTSHPPLLVVQGLTAVHVVPLPVYPGLQAQVAVFGPVDVHCAVAAQPPLFVAHGSVCVIAGASVGMLAAPSIGVAPGGGT